MARVQQSTLLFGVGEAAARAAVTEEAMRGAIKTGKVVAQRDHYGRVFVERGCLERWLEMRAHERGESEEGHFSLGRAVAEAQLRSYSVVYRAIENGELQTYVNPAGVTMIKRDSLQAWIARLPPLASSLDPLKWWSKEKVAAMVGLSVAAVDKAVRQGELVAIAVRRERSFGSLIDAELGEPWLRERAPLPAPKGHYMAVKEVAALCGCCEGAVLTAMYEGQLKARTRLRIYYLDSVDVETWRQARESAVWLRLAEAAELTGLTRRVLTAAIKSKQLPVRCQSGERYVRDHEPRVGCSGRRLRIGSRCSVCRQCSPPKPPPSRPHCLSRKCYRHSKAAPYEPSLGHSSLAGFGTNGAAREAWRRRSAAPRSRSPKQVNWFTAPSLTLPRLYAGARLRALRFPTEAGGDCAWRRGRCCAGLRPSERAWRPSSHPGHPLA